MSREQVRSMAELLLLGALWGASFLFMRVASPQFGPIALIAIRVTIAALFLVALLAWRGRVAQLRTHMLPLLVVGAINSAIPFTLFAYATLSLTAGFAAVLNATAPLFGAVVGYLWLRDRLAPSRVVGLIIGFVGVVILLWHRLSFAAERSAIVAALLAAVGYGIATHFTKRHLGNVEPLAIAAGSQIGASALLAPLAVWAWPSTLPPMSGWLAAIALGIGCTGIAYLLYFRLIKRLGPAKAITVAYLIPVFAMLWGGTFLGEVVTLSMALGCAVVLVGTTLVTRPTPATTNSTSLRLDTLHTKKTTMPDLPRQHCPVTATPAADAHAAAEHFSRLFTLETDCWDVHEGLSRADPEFVLLDVRSPQAFAKGHVPGAVNLPHGRISERTLQPYPPHTTFVVYCNGPHCNGADRAALRLASLGRPVKKMLGGVTGWLDEGFTLTTATQATAS